MALLGRRQTLRVSSPERATTGKNALTASGARVRKQDGDALRRLVQPWQARAFAYYDLLGEIKYASQFYARGLSQIRLFAGELDDDGEIQETENEQAREALERIQDPGGGRTGLLSAYGRLMFLVGESLLLVTQDEQSGLEQWEMLSTDELRITGNTYLRYKAPSLQAEEFREPSEDDWKPLEDGKTAVAYRLWQRHPRYSMIADATMQGVLDLCEELVLLTHSVRARARSRLAGAGLLLVPEEISPAPPEPVGDEDPKADIFLDDLVEAMTAPIADEGSASAVVPLVIRGKAEALKELRHLPIVDPTQLYPETGLRRECIERIAIGLDMPVEILLGLQDSNHWSAWQVDEQTWKAHLQPKAQQLVDDLTAAFLRPALKEANVPDWQRYLVGYDATAVINHPDRTKDAKDLYDKRAISKEALRTAGGFTDEDAPTEEERAEMVGIATRDSSLAWYGIPSPRGGNVETAPGVVEDAGTSSGDAGGASSGSEVEPGPPAAGDAPDDPNLTAGGNGNGNGNGRVRDELALARILGAADLAVLRAREAAGSRLRSLVKKDRELAAEVEGVRAALIPAAVGRERARAYAATADLVVGAHELILDALRVWRIPDDVAGRIADQVEKHAARTLFDERPAPLPPAFANYVAGLTAKVPTAAP